MRIRVDESFKSESESRTPIPLLFAHAGVRLQLVLLLVMFNGITILASAQRAAHSNNSGRRPVVKATVSPGPPGDFSQQEEYVDLKLSSSVRQLAHLVGLSPQTTFQLCWTLNFCFLLALILWKGVPLLRAIFQERSNSIRRAIDEAHRLSEDARRRLAEVEKSWEQLDSAIAAMQAAAEERMKNEEKAFSTQTAELTRRILYYAQSEIDRAGQRARHELKVFAADFAVSLARESIRIDERTDQELLQGFMNRLARRQEIALTTSEVSMQVANA